MFARVQIRILIPAEFYRPHLRKRPLPDKLSLKTSHLNDSKDTFSILPWELREIIAISLTTRDALALRLASRSFTAIYWSKAFWVSRFAPGNENSCIFEVKDLSNAATLQLVYRATRAHREVAQLYMRRVLWPLVEELVRIAQTKFINDDARPKIQPSEQVDWIKLAGYEIADDDATEWTPMNKAGCRQMAESVLKIPEYLQGVGITVVSFENIDYISGIRFIAGNGESRAAGYISRSCETILSLTSFRGLTAAMGSSGLEAIKLAGQAGKSAEWVGRHDYTPESERLVSHTFIKQLKIATDVSSCIFSVLARP